MQTRSKLNLKNIPINTILLKDKKRPQLLKKEKPRRIFGPPVNLFPESPNSPNLKRDIDNSLPQKTCIGLQSPAVIPSTQNICLPADKKFVLERTNICDHSRVPNICPPQRTKSLIRVSNICSAEQNSSAREPNICDSPQNGDIAVKLPGQEEVTTGTHYSQPQRELKFLIIDTESFSTKRSKDRSASTSKPLPIQISWATYTQSELLCHPSTPSSTSSPQSQQTLLPPVKKMYYITEMLILPQYKDMMITGGCYTDQTQKKHLKNLTDNSFPISKASLILDELNKDIKECDYVCAFNLDWDYHSVKHLMEILSLQTTKNPFEGNQAINLCLMYFVYLNFEAELIAKGVNEKIIDRTGRKCADANGKKNGMKKGICNVSFMLNYLSDGNFKQMHLAENDVDSEKYLLGKALQHNKLTLTSFSEKKWDKIYELIQKTANKMYAGNNGIIPSYLMDINLFNSMKFETNQLCSLCNKLVMKNTEGYIGNKCRTNILCQDCGIKVENRSKFKLTEA